MGPSKMSTIFLLIRIKWLGLECEVYTAHHLINNMRAITYTPDGCDQCVTSRPLMP